ncbi:MAG: hypothetical protein KGL39_26515 [Patescibacteria group bacterium]|nr:hypothetical protein [Patescibacteria group bacterium]
MFDVLAPEEVRVSQPSLFGGAADLELKVRSSDHDNSWVAAAKMKRAAGESLKDAIVRILTAHGPLTDDELFARYQAEGGDRTMQRVRTSRHELTLDRMPRSSILQQPRVRATGRNGRSSHGGDSQLWEAVPAGSDSNE